jgi:hypothetical protein
MLDRSFIGAGHFDSGQARMNIRSRRLRRILAHEMRDVPVSHCVEKKFERSLPVVDELDKLVVF